MSDIDPTTCGDPEDQAAMEEYYNRPLDPMTPAEIDAMEQQQVDWERRMEIIDDDLEWSREDD